MKKIENKRKIKSVRLETQFEILWFSDLINSSSIKKKEVANSDNFFKKSA